MLQSHIGLSKGHGVGPRPPHTVGLQQQLAQFEDRRLRRADRSQRPEYAFVLEKPARPLDLVCVFRRDWKLVSEVEEPGSLRLNSFVVANWQVVTTATRLVFCCDGQSRGTRGLKGTLCYVIHITIG